MALARDILKFSKLGNLFDFTNVSNAGCLINPCFSISVRTAKHWNPKFKWLRSKRNATRLLPHSEESKRRHKNLLKDSGLFPRYWRTRPLTITSATDTFDPYKPVVADGKATVLSKGMQSLAAPKAKIVDMTAMRKIKNYDANFKKDIFVQEAQDLYINAHKALMQCVKRGNESNLLQFVTEKSLVQMMDGLKNKTVRWQFIESLEPPVIVQARAQEVLIKTNLFAQITVRFHTKQTLAIYDRFGRLMFGSEILPKDVLEYVVFEKHINNENGVWKLHDKIIPEWQEASTPNTRTYRIENNEDEDLPKFFNERDPEPDPDLQVQPTTEIMQSDAKSSN